MAARRPGSSGPTTRSGSASGRDPLPARSEPTDIVGAGPESFALDYSTGVRSHDDRIVPGVDAVWVDVPGGVVEEDHVTRLLLVLSNVPADGILVDGVVRQPHPEVAEDDHDQAGAVEGVGTGAAPPVGGAVVRGSLGHDRIAETLGARRRRGQRGQDTGEDKDDRGGPGTPGQSVRGHEDSRGPHRLNAGDPLSSTPMQAGSSPSSPFLLKNTRGAMSSAKVARASCIASSLTIIRTVGSVLDPTKIRLL